jgi:hypothetical protein
MADTRFALAYAGAESTHMHAPGWVQHHVTVLVREPERVGVQVDIQGRRLHRVRSAVPKH